MLLLTGEQLPWTPALHQLFPRPFKRAVCTLLLCARAGQDTRAHAKDTRVESVDDHATPASTSDAASSHYCDAESAAPGEFSTPGSIKGERPEEEEPPMFTPFDVRLQALLGEESSQEETASPGVSAASEVTSEGGRVGLPLPVVLKIASHMAYPLSAWLQARDSA